MSSPLVSVIIPTYNRSARLRPAVLSALSAVADPSHLEIIIADDHSPDDTPSICRQLAGEFSCVRSVRLEKNGGAGSARNAGIELSRGEFIAFLDDDDWRLPGSLDAQIDRLRQVPAAIFCYGPVRFAESETGAYNGVVYPEELPEGDIFWRLAVVNFPQVASVVVRRALLPNLKVFSPQESNLADWDAWLRLAHAHPAVAVAEPVAGYRLPNPRSRQLSSRAGQTALDASRLQQQLLASLSRPRADPARAMAVRQEFLEWTSLKLYGRMLEAQGEKDGFSTREAWRALLRLKPAFALRRRVLRALAASYVPALAAGEAAGVPVGVPAAVATVHPETADAPQQEGVSVHPPTQSPSAPDEAVLLSVLIPTFNRAALLPEAVQSAVEGARDCPGTVEIWIIDDSSPDDTPAVCAQLRGRYPQVGYLRLRKNGGLAQARNAGIEVARGRYLALLDDDDLRLPGSFAPQIALLQANPEAALCYGPVLLADSNRVLSGLVHPTTLPQGDLFWELLEDNFIRVPSVVLRASALRAVGHFDPTLRRVEDQDRWVRLAHHYPLVAVEEPVAVYRQCDVTSGQLSGDHAAMARVSLQLLESWLGLGRASEAPAARREAIRTRLRDKQVRLLRSTACQCLGAGMAVAARRDLRAAWEISPRLAVRLGFPRLWLRSFFPVRPKKT